MLSMISNDRCALLALLKARFEKHLERHVGIAWDEVQVRLDKNPNALTVLAKMEETGGEPDVISMSDGSDDITFFDCAPESPKERRSLCYDGEALAARKLNKPAGSAVEMASAMGVELLTEQQYGALQMLGEFDQKTSSWVRTPAEVRSLGGAIFCDRRFGRVFTYHNGAQSYYASRGFRGLLQI